MRILRNVRCGQTKYVGGLAKSDVYRICRRYAHLEICVSLRIYRKETCRHRAIKRRILSNLRKKRANLLYSECAKRRGLRVFRKDTCGYGKEIRRILQNRVKKIRIACARKHKTVWACGYSATKLARLRRRLVQSPTRHKQTHRYAQTTLPTRRCGCKSTIFIFGAIGMRISTK